MSVFKTVQAAPADAVLGRVAAFRADPDPRKINLTVGAYYDDMGKPHVFDVVRKAEAMVVARPSSKSYLPIRGNPGLVLPTQELMFGAGHPALERLVTLQALSGTGAVRVALDFLRSFLGDQACRKRSVWTSDPTWPNHNGIATTAGFDLRHYRYLTSSMTFDYDGMVMDLESAQPGDIVILHACAHNPTGVDPTESQWNELVAVLNRKGLIPLVDSAYQGFASGDIDRDAYSIRLVASECPDAIFCQSFAKNMGLYGERMGMLHVLVADKTAMSAVGSQLDIIVRRMYSSPPCNPAFIAETVLTDPDLLQAWRTELASVAERILSVRATLRRLLEEFGAPGSWNHLTNQIGMFSFTGLSPEEVAMLLADHKIYTVGSRISMAGLNTGNIEYVARAIATVTQQTRL
ncbi:MAG: uncharacterized protein KVP18_003144 [Porospora cf. gigantea A]|uniref:uncharacterized protein n=1 Tax=Porospora cf. gigantea A TaxID=2853593 RepID=UPI00355A1246|nr:MAG: hypothetical protein KVP18_003144 [Porospora cf. gigantea A]